MPTDSACSSCGDPERRAFLREAAALATGILMGLGLNAREAAALPLMTRRGSRASGSAEVSYPVPAADGATIDKANQVILVRYQGTAYAFALSCPHQNTALRWAGEDHVFQCPKHKSRYQPDGTFISGRATRNMDRLPIRREATQLVVDVERVFESDKNPTGWAAAAVQL